MSTDAIKAYGKSSSRKWVRPLRHPVIFCGKGCVKPWSLWRSNRSPKVKTRKGNTGFCIIVYRFVFKNFVWLYLVVWPAVTKHCINFDADYQARSSSFHSPCIQPEISAFALHLSLPLVAAIIGCAQFPSWNYGRFHQLNFSVGTPFALNFHHFDHFDFPVLLVIHTNIFWATFGAHKSTFSSWNCQVQGFYCAKWASGASHVPIGFILFQIYNHSNMLTRGPGSISVSREGLV